ncbi:MAG: homoaconitate hydratase, partial [Anaerolineae bacterium]|nr:homoaconitate hydratase [Anaerolineae bacterium]
LFELDLTDRVADGDAVTLDLDALQLTTPNGTYPLPQPPAFVAQIQAEGGIVAYVQHYQRFPGETGG